MKVTNGKLHADEMMQMSFFLYDNITNKQI